MEVKASKPARQITELISKYMELFLNSERDFSTREIRSLVHAGICIKKLEEREKKKQKKNRKSKTRITKKQKNNTNRKLKDK